MPPADPYLLRLRLIERLLHLPAERLAEAETYLAGLEPSRPTAHQAAPRDWPHAPPHRGLQEGKYIVTAATLDKDHLFRGKDRLDYLQQELLDQVKRSGWVIEAWAVFSNHYHFIADKPAGAESLSDLVQELHRRTSLHVNDLDGAPERQSWYQFWDTHLTYESSYLARLSHVHQNPVRHGLVRVANLYRWCSAAWFERTATPARVKTLYGLKIDRVCVEDDFDPV